MFDIFNSVKDTNFVKITKSNWKKIEDLFAKKEQTILDQATTIEVQNKKIKELEKYKTNDDLVYHYEEMCKKYKDKNNKLECELNKLNDAIKSMDKKVDTALLLESAYLQRIAKTENRLNKCPDAPDALDYQEVGASTIKLYA